MNLLLDIGNTRVKWGLAGQQDIVQRGAFVHVGTSDLLSLFLSRWQPLSRPQQVIVANVAGQRVERCLVKAAEELWGIQPHFVAVRACLGSVQHAYEHPRQLGVDRWLALLAARYLNSAAVMIVDCGSAVTLDMLLADGGHLGGMIAPGLQMMRHSLHAETSDLPAFVSANDQLLGRNTMSGIASGTLHAIAGLVQTTVQRIESEYHLQLQLLLTGGDAQQVATVIQRSVSIEPQLVLLGLLEYLRLSTEMDGKSTAE